MISGPIVPTNSEGLLELVQRDPERIETGLRLVATGLVLDDDLAIDGLGCDAIGAPVALVAAAAGESGDRLTVRVLALHRWFARRARFLSGLIPGVSFPADCRVRILVLGSDLEADGVAGALRGLALSDVQLLEVESFRLHGHTRFGVRDLTGVDALHDTFDLPTAICAMPQREVGSRFLDLLERLDPELEIRGDRFGRRFFVAGHSLVELRCDAGGLCVRLADGDGRADDRPLADGNDVASCFDRVARRYLELLRAHRSRPATTAPDDDAGDSLAETAGAGHAVVSEAAASERPGAATRRVGRDDSMTTPTPPSHPESERRSPAHGATRDDEARGRRTVSGTIHMQLSPDEFDALQHAAIERDTPGRGGMR